MLKIKKLIFLSMFIILILTMGFSIVFFAENKVAKRGKMVRVLAGTNNVDNGTITLDYDIEIGKYEVTHTEYLDFLNSVRVTPAGIYQGKRIINIGDPNCAVKHTGKKAGSRFSFFYFNDTEIVESKDCPVIKVTWYGAAAYCNWLSKQEGLSPAYDPNSWRLKGKPETLDGYRLPTETEWQYAARGGRNGHDTIYAGSNNLDQVGWYKENSNRRIHEIGEKQPNELGIYDMSGNVQELTNTLLLQSGRSTVEKFMGSDLKSFIAARIVTGGGWNDYAGFCKVNYSPDYYFLSSRQSKSYNNLGFRVTKTRNSDSGKPTLSKVSNESEKNNRQSSRSEKSVTMKAGSTSAENGQPGLDYDIEIGKYEVTHEDFIEFLNAADVLDDGTYRGKKMIVLTAENCAIAYKQGNPILETLFNYNNGKFYFAENVYVPDKDCPVVEVTWYGAVAYCNWLSKKQGLLPAYDLENWKLKSKPVEVKGYRLPTETEWEYAASGGKNGKPTKYAGSDNLDKVGWYGENSGLKTHIVGGKLPNESGIYDMSGNVWEWTNNSRELFSTAKGGSWHSPAVYCEISGLFDFNYPDSGEIDLGFRLVRTK